jgi:hypothetical protein
MSSVTDEAKHEARRVADDARAAGADLAHQARRAAGEYAHQAKARGQEMIDSQKRRAADQLHTVGAAVHRAAEKFREEHDDNIAGYVDAMAEEVDRFAGYLERRDAGRLLRDAQQFARREPEWFLGGMFLAGLALSRFLKASGRGDDHNLPSSYRDASQPGTVGTGAPWTPAWQTSSPAADPLTDQPTPPTPGAPAGEVHHYGQQTH